MAAPRESKTVRISPQMHARLMELAADINGTADDALRILQDEYTVRVPLTRVQHERWTRGAEEVGVRLDQFVKLRVESALHGGDSLMIERTYYMARALGSYFGIGPLDGVQTKIEKPRQTT